MRDNKFVKVPNLKSFVRIKLHRQPKERIKSATVSRHSSGKYYSLCCVKKMFPKAKSPIGIDLSITDFVIFLAGKKIDNNKFTLKMEKSMECESRNLARRVLLAKKESHQSFGSRKSSKTKMQSGTFARKSNESTY